MTNFRDEELQAWVRDRTKGWKPEKLSTVRHLTEEDWRAVRLIVQRFGTLWGDGDDDVKARGLCVGRYLARAPKVERGGVTYDAPYSVGLHAAALASQGTRFEPEAPEPATPIADFLGVPSESQRELGYN